ncbi:unnamed protein product [Cylicocyclus nassatus]|uniref:Uncharacterized protein n=1 Tax=Cylicocyclus nassatus TaxID=53992 RepID=A0AA36GKV1_CYLNA|nr:unnamed protein product [Cylicocyclus nassatus]
MTARELFFDLQPSHMYQKMSADKTTPKEAEPSKSAGAGAKSEPSALPSVTGVPVDSSEPSSAIVVESTPLPKSSNIKSAKLAKGLEENPTQNVPSVVEAAVKTAEEKKNPLLKTAEKTQPSSMKTPVLPAKQQSKEKSEDRKKIMGSAVQKRTSGERTKNSAEKAPLLPSKSPQK